MRKGKNSNSNDSLAQNKLEVTPGHLDEEMRAKAFEADLNASILGAFNEKDFPTINFDSSKLIKGDCIKVLKQYPDNYFQAIIADPPYFQALTTVEWDNAWADSDAWLAWSLEWIKECKRVLRPDGLLFIFGQLGKREHVWLHLCSEAAKIMQFHDMVIWDRVIGYDDRGDSFTPQYEMALMLRKENDSKVYFDKDSVRVVYDEKTIQTYMKDKRYKDMVAREEHLRKGKKVTNLIRVPSLKGASKEKVGHPSQKPEALIDILIKSTTRPGDMILDPFLGSGTTAVVAQALGRNWVGIDLEEEYIQMSSNRLKDRFPEINDELNFSADEIEEIARNLKELRSRESS